MRCNLSVISRITNYRANPYIPLVNLGNIDKNTNMDNTDEINYFRFGFVYLFAFFHLFNFDQ